MSNKNNTLNPAKIEFISNVSNCKVITETNQKGDVGKITTTANLGIGLT